MKRLAKIWGKPTSAHAALLLCGYDGSNPAVALDLMGGLASPPLAPHGRHQPRSRLVRRRLALLPLPPSRCYHRCYLTLHNSLPANSLSDSKRTNGSVERELFAQGAETFGAISQNSWYRKYEGDLLLVFVHGIRSSCQECWRCRLPDATGKRPFWPDLLAHDPRFDGFSIYLGGYYAELDASFLGIPQASIELYNALRRPEYGKTVLEFPTIVFICHSMGGVIVRNILVDHADSFRDKRVGLVLIASPSLGSSYADLAGSLISLYGNRLARQLKFNSDSLADLDTRFRTLVDDRKIPGLRGIEAYEHHFLLHRRWLPGLNPVVTKWSANRYFKEYPLPGTDHSSAARPTDPKHPAYQLLVDFLANEMELHLPLPNSPPLILAPPPEDVVHPPESDTSRKPRKMLWLAGAGVAIAVLAFVLLLAGRPDSRRAAILAQFGKLHSPSPQAASGDPVIGFSLWRTRPAPPAAEVRGFKHRADPDAASDWTLERLTLGQVLAQGDEVRFSIESAQPGYLYLIDRDLYADGSQSKPSLIFPTTRLHGGDNFLNPGRPIEIPSFEDSPRSMTVELTRSDQTGILLTLLVTPKPLAGFAVQREEQPINEEQLSQWERQWGTQIESTEDRALLGKLYTLVEKSAASDRSHALKSSDPLPVTLFRRSGHPGEPIAATAVVKVEK